MLSDYDIGVLLQQQYDNVPDVFDVTLDISGVYCSVKHYPDVSVICFRGSTTALDFWRDFHALMVHDADLGGVEQGFLTGIRDVKAHLDTISFPNPVIICGHSLGAARALIFAAIWAQAQETINSVVVFGAPRPGSGKIRDILSGVNIRSYCNGDDPVCKVPVFLPPLEPYVEPRDFITVHEPPPDGDPWGPLIGWHHLSPLYLDGVKKLCATGS